MINIFGGPCSGKSVFASRAFQELKIAGYKCEQIPEYAKKLVYDKRFLTLKDQLYIFAKTNKELQVLEQEGLDFVILDGSLLLSKYYAEKNNYKIKSFSQFALDVFNTYDNINLFLRTIHPFQKYGRLQSEDEAQKMSEEIKAFLIQESIPFCVISHDASIQNILRTG